MTYPGIIWRSRQIMVSSRHSRMSSGCIPQLTSQVVVCLYQNRHHSNNVTCTLSNPRQLICQTEIENIRHTDIFLWLTSDPPSSFVRSVSSAGWSYCNGRKQQVPNMGDKVLPPAHFRMMAFVRFSQIWSDVGSQNCLLGQKKTFRIPLYAGGRTSQSRCY